MSSPGSSTTDCGVSRVLRADRAVLTHAQRSRRRLAVRLRPDGDRLQQDVQVPIVQTPAEIEDLLATHLVGRSIRQLQVTAPNALKTVQPDLGAVVGLPVTAANCSGRLITMVTPVCSVLIDLERVGRVVWQESADVWAVGSGKSQPTVRVMLEGGNAIDLTETAKTKRITVSVLAAGPT